MFVDEEDLNYLAPISSLVIGVCGPMDGAAPAPTGAGTASRTRPTAPTFARGSPPSTGPCSLNQLAGWLAAIPEVDARLRATPPARVADLACGSAWSSIAIAHAYPDVTVDAIDVDVASIETARANIAAAGLADRMRPTVQDASDAHLDGPYDLVTIFEALHDMNHPVEALRAARASLAEGGSVVIGDERVADRFTAPGDELERFNYGWSILHCLTVGMLDEDSAGTGTVIRADTVRAYASDAGFGRVDVLPIDHEFWRFYRLVP